MTLLTANSKEAYETSEEVRVFVKYSPLKVIARCQALFTFSIIDYIYTHIYICIHIFKFFGDWFR